MSKASRKSIEPKIYLRIKEALKQDQGRGIVRIDPNVFKKSNFRKGDTLRIFHPINRKFSVGILVPGLSEDKGRSIIRLGVFLLRNLQARLGDEVEIRKVEPILAEQVYFTTAETEIVSNYTNILAKKFQNRVISFNDILSFYYYGHRIDLEVLDYFPRVEAAKITTQTKIYIREKA